MIDWIKAQISDYYKQADLARISAAFDLASKVYDEMGDGPQKHKSFYEILFSVKPDEDTIIAAILYEAYRRGLIDAELIRSKFGNSVFKIIESVKRVLKLNYSYGQKNLQSELLHKLFLAMSKDVRVILILLVRRYYELYRIDQGIYLNGEKAFDSERVQSLAKENLEIYAPIASKLGIYKIRTSLEDLSFKYLHPESYQALSAQLKAFEREKKILIEDLVEKMKIFLKSNGVEAQVSARLKSIYSIYKKLERKDYDKLNRLNDIVAIRIVLDSDDQDLLYMVLGHLHSEWMPVTDKFKDYVTVPKSNGYQSLHTVVKGMIDGDLEQPVEVQIRTNNMHLNAEYGVAAHWLYKDFAKKGVDASIYKMDWINQLSRFYNEFLLQSAVVKKVDVNIFKDRIFVLTPNGEVKDLLRGSTPIDFAYLVHTDVGNHCMMAKVDGKAVPLDYELKTGQVVEIITSNESHPKLEWIAKTKTSLAQRRIKAWFTKNDDDSKVKDGKGILNKALYRMGHPFLDQNLSILKTYSPQGLTVLEREQLLRELARGTKSARDILRKVYPYIGNKKIPNEELEFQNRNKARKDKENDLGDDIVKDVIVGGESGLPVKIASCCSPAHGDVILGYVTRGNRITIHRINCYLVDSLNPKRMIFANWRGHKIHAGLSADLSLEIKSRAGLIKDITDTILNLGLGLADFNVRDTSKSIADNSFCIKIAFDEEMQIKNLIDRLSNVDGVVRVRRSV